MKSLKAQVAQDIQLQQYVEKEVPTGEVTDEEIQTTYDQYAEQGETDKLNVTNFEK